MGGDGGSIPKRDDLVRTRTKPEQVNKNAELLARWKHCSITQQPLQPPIVACDLGRLYNKEAVIEFLLDRSKLECASSFSHIRGLKDVKELHLTLNPAYTKAVSKSGSGEIRESPFICPISGLEMNGKYRFCFLRGCGCVFSDRALKEIKESTCVNCGKSYESDDIITLNGTEEEVAELRTRLEQHRLHEKPKGSKKRKACASETVTEPDSASGAASIDVLHSSEPAHDEEASVAKSSKLHSSQSSSSRSKLAAGSSKDHKPKTIQDDPAASEVFKSLFNTHKTAKLQTKAHWVTYNPQYF